MMHTTMPAPTRSCSYCGGLECLCRPQFRAGQVLTESDLNCLEQYVIRKQQRHNRYLHGTGVVCGMQVLCHACPGWVTVTSGFAIGPCGEEIAIPCDHQLNVCQLIRDCRTALWKNWSCEPFAAPCGPTGDSSEVEESWYVTVRYDEAETRGRTSECDPCGKPADCGCGCGKKAANGKCSCGANGTAVKTKPTPRPTPRPPVECEPNRVCEGYRLEIAPAPPKKKPKPEDLIQGTFIGAVLGCLKQGAAVLAKNPSKLTTWANAAAVIAAHTAFRTAVVKYLADHPTGACATPLQLPDAPRPPTPDEQDRPGNYITDAGVDKANEALAALVIASLRSCVCEAFFPPCPEDPTDPRLVLAVVTTRGPDCKIVDICEARCRKQLVTIPTILYWTSIFPALWESLERVCCGPLSEPLVLLLSLLASAETPVAPPGAAGNVFTPSGTGATHGLTEQSPPYEVMSFTLKLILATLKAVLGGTPPAGGTPPP
jgi:hypothetical protein